MIVSHRGLALGLAVTLLAALGGCSPTIDTRGYVPSAEAMEKIQTGSHTRADVQDILGTPSGTSALADDSWYYISRKTSTMAFFEPKVLEQNVSVVEFDGNGMVKDVRHFTLADGIVISPVGRKTPAAGKELSVLEQLFGNFGKFNNAKTSSR